MELLSNLWVHGVSFVVVLTVIVFVHEWGHYIIARLNGVRVETFSIGFGRELFGWNDRYGTRWKVSMIPLGGYVKFFGDANAVSMPGEALPDLAPAERAVSFHHKPVWRRAAVVFAGPAANFIFAALVFAVLFATIGQPFTPPIVGGVLPNTPAAVAGFQAGDRIVSVEGHSIERFQDLQMFIAFRADTALAVGIERAGAPLTLVVTPRRVERADGVGGSAKVGQIGIQSTSKFEFVRRPPLGALWYGVRQCSDIVQTTMTYLFGIAEGRESGDSLSGPLGIANITSEVARVGLADLVQLMAMLSVSIGLVNLFPIPVLDGGHLLFYAVEAIRGRPLGEKAQEYSFRLGLVFVLTVFVFATWHDLIKFGIGPFLSGLFS
jgi:regulator of sigma E protease